MDPPHIGHVCAGHHLLSQQLEAQLRQQQRGVAGKGGGTSMKAQARHQPLGGSAGPPPKQALVSMGRTGPDATQSGTAGCRVPAAWGRPALANSAVTFHAMPMHGLHACMSSCTALSCKLGGPSMRPLQPPLSAALAALHETRQREPQPEGRSQSKPAVNARSNPVKSQTPTCCAMRSTSSSGSSMESSASGR